jgi:hypothetical protein
MSVDYDGVVSICDAHGICLPVDCVDMVVEIVRHATAHPDHSGDGSEKSDAAALAAEFMVAARNAQMFQDIRDVVATCADLKSKAPSRHVEAQRLLPLLDAFLGVGYTGRVMAFKRALDGFPAAQTKDES